MRLYISYGAVLMEDGKDKKSSGTMRKLFEGTVDPKTQKRFHASEDVLHLLLQLNKKQNLQMRYHTPDGNFDSPLLMLAVRYAPSRFAEIMCAQDPGALKEHMIFSGGMMLSVVGALSDRIKNSKTTAEFKECMQILEVLLVDAKIDLLEIDKYHESKLSHFAMLWNATKNAKHDLNLLKKAIIDKRGEEEFKKCLGTLKK